MYVCMYEEKKKNRTEKRKSKTCSPAWPGSGKCCVGIAIAVVAGAAATAAAVHAASAVYFGSPDSTSQHTKYV